jgi:hypothetical protein
VARALRGVAAAEALAAQRAAAEAETLRRVEAVESKRGAAPSPDAPRAAALQRRAWVQEDKVEGRFDALERALSASVAADQRARRQREWAEAVQSAVATVRDSGRAPASVPSAALAATIKVNRHGSVVIRQREG